MRRLSPRTTWQQARLAIKTIFALDPFNPVHPISLLSSLSSQANLTSHLLTSQLIVALTYPGGSSGSDTKCIAASMLQCFWQFSTPPNPPQPLSSHSHSQCLSPQVNHNTYWRSWWALRSGGARHLENNAREVSVKLLASACEGELLRGEAGHMEQLSSTRLGNLDCPRGLRSEATAIQDRVAKKQQQDAGRGYCSSCRDLEERKAVIFLQKKIHFH